MVGEGPAVTPLAAVDVEFWKQQAVQAAVWQGDCVVGGGGGSDCAGADETLGPVKIGGNLTIESGQQLTIAGPIWVEGDVVIDSNVEIKVADILGSEGVVIVVDYPQDRLSRGKIVTASKVTFVQTAAYGPAVLVSTNMGDNCTADPAVKVSSNTATVVFSAPDGCIWFEANSFVRGVLAKKVHLSGNSQIEYDPRLAYIVLKTGLGGWAVTSYREIE